MLILDDEQMRRLARQAVREFPARILAHWQALRPGLEDRVPRSELRELADAVLREASADPQATEAGIVMMADLRLHALLQQRRGPP